MKDKISEQISALFDDELEHEEHELLLRRLKQEAGLQQALSRYQIIGDAMRQHLSDAASVDLARKVSESIDAEPDIAARASEARHMMLIKPVAGLAIAASVAAMAVIGLQDMGQFQSPEQATPRLAQIQAQPQSHNGILRASAGTHWDRQQPETERRLNGYLVNHSEYTSNISLQGMINYARIAGYDSKKKDK